MSICVNHVRPSPVPVPATDPAAPTKAYEQMTVQELHDLCDERGLRYTAKTRKADLIAALEADGA